MNGIVFHSLRNLETVALSSNDCIDRQFKGPNEIAEIKDVITSMCGFYEETETLITSRTASTSANYQTNVPQDDSARKISQILNIQRQQFEDLEALVHQVITKKDACLLEVQRLKEDQLTCTNLNIKYQKDLLTKDVDHSKILEAKAKEIFDLQNQLTLKISELRMAEEYIKRQNAKYDIANV